MSDTRVGLAPLPFADIYLDRPFGCEATPLRYTTPLFRFHTCDALYLINMPNTSKTSKRKPPISSTSKNSKTSEPCKTSRPSRPTKASRNAGTSKLSTTSNTSNASNAAHISPDTNIVPHSTPSQLSQSVSSLLLEWPPDKEPIPLRSFFKTSVGSLPPCEPQDWSDDPRFCEHKPGCLHMIGPGDKYVIVPNTDGTYRFVSPDCFTSEDEIEGSTAWLSRNPSVFQTLHSPRSRNRLFLNEPGGIEHDQRFVAAAECVLCRSKFVSDTAIGRVSWNGSSYTHLLSHFKCYLQWSAGSPSSPQSQATSCTTIGGSFGNDNPFPPFPG
ncbi:hypothetical protein DB88DRAFT_315252 [Papiliotrema laurentii]|uniref:Uncharacterized protein n=1 Tax=Papiliotrema laurentii TaxID=5418 RepID=A0AAD9CXF1_PAPLA|nr:hypothetical protein DB88DRAFT_315252 [Papiliotrema laurentii]